MREPFNLYESQIFRGVSTDNSCNIFVSSFVLPVKDTAVRPVARTRNLDRRTAIAYIST